MFFPLCTNFLYLPSNILGSGKIPIRSSYVRPTVGPSIEIRVGLERDEVGRWNFTIFLLKLERGNWKDLAKTFVLYWSILVLKMRKIN